MGTRSFVGVYDDQGEWAARYCHWDGYPDGVGKSLWDNYQKSFKDNLGAMVEIMISEKVGWSSLAGKDLTLPPVWFDGYKFPGGEGFPSKDTREMRTTEEIRPKLNRLQIELQLTDAEFTDLLYEKAPTSYTARGETGELLIRSTDSDFADTEWGYIFNVSDRRMDVYTGYENPVKIGSYQLDGPEPDWPNLGSQEE